MIEQDWAIILARVQFAFTVSFHFLFPAFTIGLASFLAVLEGLWIKTGKGVYANLYRYWLKIFAVVFAMGVVSGIVMSYQFGTNWSRFSDIAGNIVGPLMAYEVLMAFFLEATFLGILLFGRNRVAPKFFFLSAVMVALGTLASAFWILSANSWMHTPTGHEVRDGLFYPVDWLAVVFNPSFPYRFMHMVTACFLTTAFVVIGVSAWHLLRNRAPEAGRKALSMGLWLVLLLAPAQVVIGDLHGLNTLEHQPAKIAAMEGHWENKPGEGAPLILFGWPDMKAETTRYAVAVPNLGGLILTHDWNGQYPGLKEFAPADRPPSAPVFWSFRIMVGLGVLMLLLGLWSLWLRWRGGLYRTRPFLKLAVAMGPAGLVAILAGWITTEMGRQPWIVYNVMRTEDAVSNHSALTMSVTLLIFIIVYFAVFGVGLLYMLKIAGRGPSTFHDPAPLDNALRRPARPLSAAPDTIDPIGPADNGEKG